MLEDKGSKIWTPYTRSNILTPAASAAAYRAATSSHSIASAAPYRDLNAENKLQHPHTAVSAAPYRAATSSHSSVRSSVSRSNILTQQCPQQRIAQQHPHTAASAAAYRAATSSHSGVRSTVSRSTCRK